MTEYEIELTAEQRMDRLDKNFLRGDITAPEYNEAVIRLHEWAEACYQQIKKELKR